MIAFEKELSFEKELPKKEPVSYGTKTIEMKRQIPNVENWYRLAGYGMPKDELERYNLVCAMDKFKNTSEPLTQSETEILKKWKI